MSEKTKSKRLITIVTTILIVTMIFAGLSFFYAYSLHNDNTANHTQTSTKYSVVVITAYGTTYYKVYNISASTWSEWVPAGGSVTSVINYYLTWDNNLCLTVLGTDGMIYHKILNIEKGTTVLDFAIIYK